MKAATRIAVRGRAGNRCGDCWRPQSTSPLIPLLVEHIVAKKHDGDEDFDNLALACAECNLHKGSDLTGIDPETLLLTPLYHPRRDRWLDHFRWDGVRIVGLTPAGCTTIRPLQLNMPARLRVRRATGG